MGTRNNARHTTGNQDASYYARDQYVGGGRHARVPQQGVPQQAYQQRPQQGVPRSAHATQAAYQRTQQQASARGYGAASSAYGGSHARPTAQELYPGYVNNRKKKSTLKRVLCGVLAAVLALVLVGVGYGIWYTITLNDALSMGAEQNAAVHEALVASEAGQPFYVLVLGSDSREGSGTSDKEYESGDQQRSDVMILVRVDPSVRELTMVTIPRDTPLTLDDGSVVKINEAYNIGGAPMTIKAVSDLTGVPISHYAEIHFSELEEIVDKLGGVTVNVDTELSYQDALTGETITIEPGEQTLDGQQAQIFARARHEYATDQDMHRQNNVRELAEAILKKALDAPIYELPNVVLSLASCVGTDMQTPEIISLASSFAGGSGKMTIYSCSGPSAGDINEAAGGMWLCYENPEGWANLMEVVESGADPSDVDVNSTAIIP